MVAAGCVALGWPAAGPGHVRAADTGYTVALAAGHDSNPVGASGASRDAAFTELRARGSARLRPRTRNQLFLAFSGTHRVHGSGQSAADATRAAVLAGLAFIPYRNGPRNVSVLLGGEYEIRRETFVDPATGEVFRYLDPTAGPAGTPLPERFDSNTGEAFAELRFQVARRVRLALETRYQRRDHIEDYRAVAGVDSLDHRSLTLTPELRLRLPSRATLTLSYSATDRDYDDQPALDSGGTEVSGAYRRYRYRGHRLDLALEPLAGMDLRLGYRDLDRSDLYAGYYDSGTTTVYCRLEGELGRRGLLRFHASRSGVGYDRATVGNDPNGELRGGDVATALVRYERSFRTPLAAFVEFGSQTMDNHDPVLARDRQWVMTGLEFRR